jgi:drug/metabolite transporter (DMT)-like permease
MIADVSADLEGIAFALASGALASGLGYVIWYEAAAVMRSSSAAVVQLTVPVIAAAGGVVILGESITLRLLLAAFAILGGVALFFIQGARWPQAAANKT